MDESLLLKVSVIASVAGIFLLIFTDGFYTLPEVKIEDITLDDAGKQLIILGEVTKSSSRSGHLFLELFDGTGKIPAVAFNSEMKVKKGEFVELEGKVERYKGKPELIISKIQLLNLEP